ncbi:MAG: hypothetical protein LBU86_04415, partial [Oscillospiraceae bacterium]|jgi:hypothetical protein|nr:hypothetical protein [Oscillospiraceae bacterium]
MDGSSENIRDYLASAELSPSSLESGDKIRLAVHSLQLNPNAYFARLDLIKWQYGEEALEYNGKVLDKLEQIEPELAQIGNRAAMSFCAAKIAMEIHKFDRYGDMSLDHFIKVQYNNAKKTVRDLYVRKIGKGRPKKAATNKDAEYRARIDAEFAEVFGSRSVYEILKELLTGYGVSAPGEKHTKTEWQELILNNAAFQASRNEVHEMLEEETASAPAIEYEEHRHDDDTQEQSHSTTSLENDMQKSVMSRYANEHEKDVKIVKDGQVGGKIVPDEKTGRPKKVGWHLAQLTYLQYDMSAEELAAALAALKEHGTPQYVGAPYVPPTPPEPEPAMPDFEEFKVYFLKDRKKCTAKQRVDNQVALEVMRLYGWEGLDGYRKIFARLGEDYASKKAAELGEKPDAAKKLTKDAVRGMVERGSRMLDTFMHSSEIGYDQ